MDLKPRRGDDRVAIPVTFDVKYSVLVFKMSKIYISLAAIALFFILWVIVMFIAASGNYRIIATVIAFLIVPTVCRMGIIGEFKYRKSYKYLVANNFQYDYSLFWSIYDTSTSSPTVFFHTSGMSSVFVAFDKDVIVGKGDSSDYEHFEAISEAYQLLAKKGISCIHIDYMDNVGKDTRLASLFESAKSCESEDLRNCILDMLDYMQWYMMGTYADYDVFCFTSKLRPDLFIDELIPVLSAFEQGNYIRYRILTRPEVRDLVSSVFSVSDFSVTRACDNLFSSKGTTSYLKVIWTELDGKREIVNKTREQLADEARITAQEREAVKQKRRRKSNQPMVAVNLFEDEEDTASLETQEDKPPIIDGVFIGRTGNPTMNTNSSRVSAPVNSTKQSGFENNMTTISADEEFDLFSDDDE